MIAALTSYEGEPVSPALVIGSPEESSRFMTRARAEKLVERGQVFGAQAQRGADGFIRVLQEARAGNAHLVLGLAWHDLVELMWGRPLSELALANRPERVVERVALVQSLRAVVDGRGKPLPMKAVAERLGVSPGLVHRDLNPGGTGKVIDLDPEREPVAEPEPIGHLPKTTQVVILIARQGERGLTCFELEEETGWRHGSASGALSRCKRQHRVRPTGRIRGGYEVYEADMPDYEEQK